MHLNTVLSSALAGAAMLLASAANANTWTVDTGQSTLGFEVEQGGTPLTGTFQTWSATIEFDPQAPEKANITAIVNTASAVTGNAQFDGTLPSSEWFDVASFPDAEFTASGATLIEGTTYRAEGNLSIKGASHPATIVFDLEIDGDTAHAIGTATVDRMAYKLGAGVGTDSVGGLVTVTLDLTASR